MASESIEDGISMRQLLQSFHPIPFSFQPFLPLKLNFLDIK